MSFGSVMLKGFRAQDIEWTHRVASPNKEAHW